MPLLGLDEFGCDLRCPCCGSLLKNDLSGCCGCGEKFVTIRSKPVLIDFSRSVIDQDELVHRCGASPVKRWGRRSGGGPRAQLVQTLVEYLRGRNRVAGENVQTFVRLARTLRSRPRVLIIGGGTVGAGLDSLYSDPEVDIIAFDIYDSRMVQLIADAHQIPLREHCIDGVVVQAVLEHVLDPELVVSELRRVLRPGGVVYSETPFLQQVHEGPYDFTRYTESGHRYLFRHFAEVASGPVAGPAVALIWCLEFFVRGLFRSRTVGRIVRVALVWLRWADKAIPAGYVIDGASAFYFLGTLTTAPISGRDVVRRYRGRAG